MSSKHFVLTIEERPNDFKPLLNDNLQTIEEIDNFTSKYTKEEFVNYLISNNIITGNYNDNFQIIFNNNGIRRLDTGIIFKDNYIESFDNYICNFIRSNISNSNVLNELIQKINNNRLLSDYIKEIFKVLFNNRHLPEEDLDYILSYISVTDYLDLRIIYLIIKKNIESKIKEKKLK